MNKLTHHDASRTLAAINATLRRADDLHWSDPAFLEWERGQVGAGDTVRNHRDGVDHTRHAPGPRHANRYAWGCHVQPMIQAFDSDDDPGSPMHIAVDNYPDQVTMSGPLMLGPEPDTVGAPGPRTVSFDVTPDMSAWNALARRVRRPDDHYTLRCSTRPVTGHVPQMVILDEAIGWAPDPDRVAEMTEAFSRCVNELAEGLSGALRAAAVPVRHFAGLMPDHADRPPADDDPRARALARRRATQAWHTFTDRPQNRRRGDR